MFISMHMLSDWLKHHKLHIDISQGNMVLNKVRFCATANSATDGATLYLLADIRAVQNETMHGVSCLNNKDCIFIETDHPELVYSEILEIFDYYHNLEQQALELITKPGSLSTLLDLLAQKISHNVYLSDTGAKLLAAARNFPTPQETLEYEELLLQEGRLPLSLALRFLESGMYDPSLKRACRHTPDWYPCSHVGRNIYMFGEYVARLTFPEDIGPLSPGEIQFADVIGDFIEKWYETTKTNASDFAVTSFYRQLLSNNSDYTNDEISFYSAMLRWDDKSEKYFVCIESSQKSEANLKFLLSHIQDTFDPLHPFFFESYLCLVINTSLASYDESIRKLGQVLSYTNTYAGLSYRFYDILDLRQAYEEAKIGLEFGSTNSGSITKCSNCKLEYIYTILNTHLKIDPASGKLHKLRDYDQLHNTDYYVTLYSYLLNERSQSITAEKLNLHRNTLARRIEKIYELIETNLDSPMERLSLLFSFFSAEGKPLNYL